MMKIFTTLVLALSLADTSIATVPEETAVTEPHTWTDMKILELLEDRTAAIPEEINDRLVDFQMIFKVIDDDANDGKDRALRGSTQSLEGEAANSARKLDNGTIITRDNTGNVICRWCDDDPGAMERHCECNTSDDAFCRYCWANRFDQDITGQLCERFCWWDYV